MYNFDMGAPYTSFVQQINDAQDPKTGSVPDCVPYYGHGWSGVLPGGFFFSEVEEGGMCVLGSTC